MDTQQIYIIYVIRIQPNTCQSRRRSEIKIKYVGTVVVVLRAIETGDHLHFYINI